MTEASKSFISKAKRVGAVAMVTGSTWFGADQIANAASRSSKPTSEQSSSPLGQEGGPTSSWTLVGKVSGETRVICADGSYDPKECPPADKVDLGTVPTGATRMDIGAAILQEPGRVKQDQPNQWAEVKYWTSSDLTDKSKSYPVPMFGFKVMWAEIAQG